MKKVKIFVCMIAALFCVNLQVLAAEVNTDTTTEREEQGTALIDPRGMYLQRGISRISDIGDGWIRASGTTDAQMTTEVSVYVRVDRFVNGNWQVYTSWGEEKKGTTITTYRDFKVPKGYFYRVYCNHYAGPDTSTSYTDGLFID